MRWIVAFWGDQGLSFSRVFGATRPQLTFDASLWGLGGVVATASSSEALQFFHEPLTSDDCTRFQVDLGDAKGQQCWETLSVLVGLNLWGPLLAKSQGNRQSQKRFRHNFVMHSEVGKLFTVFKWDWSRNRFGA